MQRACDQKRAKTEGKCEDWECSGIGWCEDCLKAARKDER